MARSETLKTNSVSSDTPEIFRKYTEKTSHRNNELLFVAMMVVLDIL